MAWIVTFLFVCLILSASWSINILFEEFVENRSLQQRLGAQVTAADYFQTRLPVAFLCTLLVLVILQLWRWTYLHFQILKAQEMSTSVPKKWSFFFFSSMTLSLTYLYPSANLLFLQDHQRRAAGDLRSRGETTQMLTPASGTHTQAEF